MADEEEVNHGGDDGNHGQQEGWSSPVNDIDWLVQGVDLSQVPVNSVVNATPPREQREDSKERRKELSLMDKLMHKTQVKVMVILIEICFCCIWLDSLSSVILPSVQPMLMAILPDLITQAINSTTIKSRPIKRKMMDGQLIHQVPMNLNDLGAVS